MGALQSSIESLHSELANIVGLIVVQHIHATCGVITMARIVCNPEESRYLLIIVFNSHFHGPSAVERRRLAKYAHGNVKGLQVFEVGEHESIEVALREAKLSDEWIALRFGLPEEYLAF